MSSNEAFAREKTRTKVIRFLLYFVITFFVIAGRSAQWVLQEWGDLTLDEVLFTMTQPLTGTDSGIIMSYFVYAVVPGVVILVALMVVEHIFLMKKQPPKGSRTKDENGKKIRVPAELTPEMESELRADHEKKNTRVRSILRAWLLPACGVAAAVFGIIQISGLWTKLGVSEHLSSLGEESTWIEDNYADPKSVKLTFPEKKRNLIYIFLESMEVSYSDKKSGGLFDTNYIPRLTKLSEENENFSGKDKTVLDGGNSLKYTTWTMGGMFAATSGLPLKIPLELKGVGTNFMNTQTSFFSDLTCLGDILEAEGYDMNMSFGSDATFGGRRLCFTEHGNFNFYDWKHYTTNGELPSDYKVWWGFEDEKLFNFAKDRLTQLGEGDKPFDFTMLTVDTHYPDGYVCDLCGDEYDTQYANVIKCSDNQVADFVEWCQQQPWYENTTIVLSGDHPTMNKEFCSSASYDYRRKVYTAYINAPITPERDDYREFATVDNFPTTLAALGVEIEGNRLGLGTNLFSSEDTLVERDGLDFVNTELQKASKWMDEQSNLQEVSADIEYRDYDPETQTITMVLTNVTSDEVDSFHVSMHMYGYIINGKDYVSWSDSVEEKPGEYVVTIKIPTDKAFNGRIKIQPHCMIDGVRGIHLDTHYYHLSYDEGGANAEAYQCDRYGEELKQPTFWDKVAQWWSGLWPL
ncbi:MAG: LTA synthase family protein [Lachnospiraceae bacterium]|nr:LTA synthase family protein [Lachnospiraceae bacterium]